MVKVATDMARPRTLLKISEQGSGDGAQGRQQTRW